MSHRIGVKALDSYFLLGQNSLKRDFLYFDKLAFTYNELLSSERLIKKFVNPVYHDLIKSKRAEVEFLIEEGILLPIKVNSILDFMTANQEAVQEEMADLRLPISDWLLFHSYLLEEMENKEYTPQELQLNFVALHGSSEALVRIISLVKNLRETENEYYPIISDLLKLDNNQENKNAVLNIVLENIPTIDESVSWEQLIDFKKNPDTKNKYLALRNWMIEMSLKSYSKMEIKDKFEFLLSEYEMHMKLNRIKYHSGKMETILVASSEIIENIVKLNFSKAMKSVFQIHKQNIALTEAELNTKGRELAYIHKIKRELKK